MDVDIPTASSSTSPLSYLEHQEAGSSSDLKPLWTKLRTQYEKKLWHNLTVTLSDFVSHPSSGPFQIELFEKFISTIESKINTLKLVEIARRVGREYSEPDLTLKFLQSVHDRLPSPYPVEATETTPAQPAPQKPIPEAYALSLSSIAYAQLLLGDLPATKKSLDECEKVLSEQDGVEPIVNAGYYGVAGDYHKVKADYAPYYKNALLYLACVDINSEMSAEERQSRAHDLCIAALLGDTIYNFGELLQHPILQELENSEWRWIKDLISAFNKGEIGKFETYSTQFEKESSYSFLRQKICLMALIQFAFSRPRKGAARSTTFQSIAEATHVPVHEVEHLIMKGLSLKLIRGTIDQVDKSVEITWVQPRVLEDEQLKTLHDLFGSWRNNVKWVATETERRRVEAKDKVSGVTGITA